MFEFNGKSNAVKNERCGSYYAGNITMEVSFFAETKLGITLLQFSIRFYTIRRRKLTNLYGRIVSGEFNNRSPTS